MPTLKVATEPPKLPEHQRCVEHLAVERTSLAWVRTSISLIGLGFVVAKFGVWLQQLTPHLDAKTESHSTEISLPIGIGMMAFGGLLTAFAAWHCRQAHLSVERGKVQPRHHLVMIVTVAMTLTATGLTIYMVLTTRGF